MIGKNRNGVKYHIFLSKYFEDNNGLVEKQTVIASQTVDNKTMRIKGCNAIFRISILVLFWNKKKIKNRVNIN
jgi:hypothetical protein